MNPEQPPPSEPEAGDTAMFRAFVDAEPEPVARQPAVSGVVAAVVGVVAVIVVVVLLLVL